LLDLNSDHPNTAIIILEALEFFFTFLNHHDLLVRRIGCRNIDRIIANKKNYVSIIFNNTFFVEQMAYMIYLNVNDVIFYFDKCLFFLFKINNIERIISSGIEAHLEQLTNFGLLDEVFRILDVGNKKSVIIALKMVSNIFQNLNKLEPEKRILILKKIRELDSFTILEILQRSSHAEIQRLARLVATKLTRSDLEFSILPRVHFFFPKKIKIKKKFFFNFEKN